MADRAMEFEGIILAEEDPREYGEYLEAQLWAIQREEKWVPPKKRGKKSRRRRHANLRRPR